MKTCTLSLVLCFLNLFSKFKIKLKIKSFKLFLLHPFSVINQGLSAYQKSIEESHLMKSLTLNHKITQLPTIDLLEFYPVFEEELTTYSFLDGTSLITDIILLKKLAKNLTDCNYLEIGSWRGESIANVSEVADKCTSITLSPKEMSELNLSKEFIEVHGIFSKDKKNITEILHNSRNFDFNSFKQKFDLIFIDGDHSYEGVLNDTIKTFNLRKDSSSVIVWHDYGFSTEIVRYSVLKAILDGVPSEKHKNLYHVSNTMCAIYIENQKFTTYKTTFPTFPNKIFSLRIKACPI
jgi:predicted O-methyltransferase YrrM